MTRFQEYDRTRKKKCLAEGNALLATLAKAVSGDESFSFYRKLLLAEQQVVSKREGSRVEVVMNEYCEAIDLARRQGFVHFEAFANERVGRFLKKEEQPARAREHLSRAVELYRGWGSKSKRSPMLRNYWKTSRIHETTLTELFDLI